MVNAHDTSNNRYERKFELNGGNSNDRDNDYNDVHDNRQRTGKK